jgi:competence protein ComEC
MKADRLILPSLADESGFADLIQAAGARNVPVSRCSEGEMIRLDDRTYLQVLSPEQNCPVDEASLNNTSFVLKLCYGQTTILFTGDAETEVEDELIAEDSKLSANVIKIAHHGSLSSTSKAFLGKVNPNAAIISVGKNNFGHPSPMTISLLEESNVRCFRTDESGAVILESNGRTINIKRTVKESEKYQ